MTDEERLAEIEGRLQAVPPAPWRSWVEGRDHSGGDSFIQTGGKHGGPDIYTHASYADTTSVPVDVRLRTYDAVQDFVAAARQDEPWLVDRVRALTAECDALIVERDYGPAPGCPSMLSAYSCDLPRGHDGPHRTSCEDGRLLWARAPGEWSRDTGEEVDS